MYLSRIWKLRVVCKILISVDLLNVMLLDMPCERKEANQCLVAGRAKAAGKDGELDDDERGAEKNA